jgi:hypothetical protein
MLCLLCLRKFKESLKRWLPCGSSLRLWFLMERERAKQVKFLPCIFLLGVSCQLRKKADDFRPMEQCFKCKHYLRFLREMEEEEEKVHAEFNRIRKFGYPKGIGELGS